MRRSILNLQVQTDGQTVGQQLRFRPPAGWIPEIEAARSSRRGRSIVPLEPFFQIAAKVSPQGPVKLVHHDLQHHNLIVLNPVTERHLPLAGTRL